jgi:hypothetical protein
MLDSFSAVPADTNKTVLLSSSVLKEFRIKPTVWYELDSRLD